MTEKEFIGHSAQERHDVFLAAAEEKGVTDVVVEKDFWVTFILGRLFADPELADVLRFKGGTSLSKGYALIDRFSEDIDLVLEWSKVSRELGGCLISDRAMSTKEARELQRKMNENVPRYIREVLLPKINDRLEGVLKAVYDERFEHGDMGVILVPYQSTCPEDVYLQPHVKLEIGALAAPCPNETKSIRSLVTEFTGTVDSPSVEIPMVTELQTFWEKISILHGEHHRDEAHAYQGGAINRQSRHYYDVAMILAKYRAEKILASAELLENAVWYTQTYHPRKWAHLELARKGTLEVVPSEYALRELRQDYAGMRNMIWGDYPPFDEMLKAIAVFAEKFNERERL